MLSTTRKATYSGGGTVETVMDRTDADCGLPVMDADPADPPFYNLPDAPATAKKCDTAFKQKIEDVPGGGARLCEGGDPAAQPPVPPQTITKLEVLDKFRTWVVIECPAGSKCYLCVHQWDWQLEYDVNVANVNRAAGTADLTVNKSCVSQTFKGDCKAADFNNVKVTGKSANNCAKTKKTGL